MMPKIQQFLSRFRSYGQQVRAFVLNLRDIRTLGQLVFLVMVLLVSWSGIKSIQANYDLQKQIGEIKQQNNLKKLENANITLENEYYKSSQYLELTARQNFGLAKPGETVLLVPKSVALANTVATPAAPTETVATQKLPTWQQNFQDWVDYLLHRNSN